MAYRYNYNERSCFEGEDHRDNWDSPSAKAVQDTLVEECDGKIVKSGGPELIDEIFSEGFEKYIEAEKAE